jgi:hypothetical protein
MWLQIACRPQQYADDDIEAASGSKHCASQLRGAFSRLHESLVVGSSAGSHRCNRTSRLQLEYVQAAQNSISTTPVVCGFVGVRPKVLVNDERSQMLQSSCHTTLVSRRCSPSRSGCTSVIVAANDSA